MTGPWCWRCACLACLSLAQLCALTLNATWCAQDDTSFAPNFISKWNDYMAKLNESQWDLIFFGLGDRNFVDHGGMFIPQQHPASRTAGSYAIRGKAAAKLQSSMVPFTTVSDGELDYQMWIHQMHVLWASPHLAWEATKGCSFYQVLCQSFCHAASPRQCPFFSWEADVTPFLDRPEQHLRVLWIRCGGSKSVLRGDGMSTKVFPAAIWSRP